MDSPGIVDRKQLVGARPPKRATNVGASLWKQERGARAAARDTAEVFGVERVFRKGENIDLAVQSGNTRPKMGITNNIKLGKDTGRLKTQGSLLVGNNNVLQTWEQNNSSKARSVVLDASKTPAERRNDSLRVGAPRDIDITA